MSLEEAAKELEKLELQMQQRQEHARGNGPARRSNGHWREEKKSPANNVEGDKSTDVGVDMTGERSSRHDGARDRPGNHPASTKGTSKTYFFSPSVDDTGGVIHAEVSSAPQTGKAAAFVRPTSPTRVHLRRTGSVEIERGGIDFAGGRQQHEEASPRLNRRHDGIFDENDAVRSSVGVGGSLGLGHSREHDAGGGHRHVDDRWPPETTGTVRSSTDDLLHEGRYRHLLSSSEGSARYAIGADGGKDTGGSGHRGGLGKGWRTEADADLSDIKATVRRIGGVKSSLSAGSGQYHGGDIFGCDSSTFAAESLRHTSASGGAATTATDVLDRHASPNARTTDPRAGRGVGSYSSSVGGYAAAAAPGAGAGAGARAGALGGAGTAAGASGWGASTGSKAVLSALRALQDKIRKLESERDRASVEAGSLKRQIAALQSTQERVSQASSAEAQEKTLAARLAYERLQADKAAAEIRLRKADEQKRLLAREAEASKERSAAAEAARDQAEARVRSLEDRLLGIGRQEEKTDAAEASALEQATARAREKADRIGSLKAKVGHMQEAAAAERSLREEAEDGLARALSAKGKLERFLQGVLQVNEELVKAAAGGKGDSSKRKKQKRTRVSSVPGGGGGGRITGAKSNSKAPTLPARGGGSGMPREDFNIGSHTAKRASTRESTRARREKQTLKRASRVTTAGLSNPPVGGLLGQGPSRAPRQRRAPSRQEWGNASDAANVAARRSRMARSATAAAAATAHSGARAVPFVATGNGAESYNVVSAVSKAVRTARRGKPRESLEALYAEVGNAVLDSTKDVPFMFEDTYNTRAPAQRGRRNVRGASQLQPQPPPPPTRRSGRALVDVAIPDLRGFNLGSRSPDDRRNGGETWSGGREQWQREWDRAIGCPPAPEPPPRQGSSVATRRESNERSVMQGLEGARRERAKGGAVATTVYEASSEETFDSDEDDSEGNAEEKDADEESEEDDGDQEQEEKDYDNDHVNRHSEDGGSGGGKSEVRQAGEDEIDDESSFGDQVTARQKSEHEKYVSGLPATDASLSSGDERVWRAATRRS